MPHLFRVIVPVGDIERAAHFYSALLGVAGQRVSPRRHYFECEGTTLACYDPQADGDGRVAQPLPEPVYIAVDDLNVRKRPNRGCVLLRCCGAGPGSPLTAGMNTAGRPCCAPRETGHAGRSICLNYTRPSTRRNIFRRVCRSRVGPIDNTARLRGRAGEWSDLDGRSTVLVVKKLPAKAGAKDSSRMAQLFPDES